MEANGWLGGTADSCFVVDESGFAKKGKHSVGVARQWNGRQGKVDNCQVGVFGALGKGHLASLTDLRLYLPKEWVDNPGRCRKAGVPASERESRIRRNNAPANFPFNTMRQFSLNLLQLFCRL